MFLSSYWGWWSSITSFGNDSCFGYSISFLDILSCIRLDRLDFHWWFLSSSCSGWDLCFCLYIIAIILSFISLAITLSLPISRQWYRDLIPPAQDWNHRIHCDWMIYFGDSVFLDYFSSLIGIYNNMMHSMASKNHDSH